MKLCTNLHSTGCIDCIVGVGRNVHVQPSWRLCMRSCTSTASPWWVWVETKISWKTEAAEEEGASLNLLRCAHIPHLMKCTINLPLHMHEREWRWVEKLLGCFFPTPPLSLGWDSGYSHMKKTKHREFAVSQRTSPVALPHLAATAAGCYRVFTWWCGFVAGECPVEYERHFALTESAPSMTIRVVERSPAAEAQR